MKQGEGRRKLRMSQPQSRKAKTAQYENRKKDERIEHCSDLVFNNSEGVSASLNFGRQDNQ